MPRVQVSTRGGTTFLAMAVMLHGAGSVPMPSPQLNPDDEPNVPAGKIGPARDQLRLLLVQVPGAHPEKAREAVPIPPFAKGSSGAAFPLAPVLYAVGIAVRPEDLPGI